MPIKVTIESFIKKSREVHGDIYDYSKTIYTGTKGKVIIICRKHGEFLQRSSHHTSGHGCRKCVDDAKSKAKTLTTDEFIERAKKIHGDTYDYSKVEYIRTDLKVTIGCDIHGDFEMNLNNHAGGHQGCPTCGRITTSRSLLVQEPTILYYVKFSTYDGPIYKIGITVARRGVIGRFSGKQIPPYEILREVVYNTGQEAFKEEQRLHREFKEFQYKGPKVLPGGNTELFTKDVLDLDFDLHLDRDSL